MSMTMTVKVMVTRMTNDYDDDIEDEGGIEGDGGIEDDQDNDDDDGDIEDGQDNDDDDGGDADFGGGIQLHPPICLGRLNTRLKNISRRKHICIYTVVFI